MGFLDQIPMWAQVVGAVVLFAILSFALFRLLRRLSAEDAAIAAPASASDSNPGGNAEAYAPMFRRVSPPTQPVPVAVTPDAPRPGLSATTSTPSRTPTKPVPFSESAPTEILPSPASSAVTLASPVPIARPAITPRPPAPPGLSGLPQRAVKIQPRTGAPIGDISAKPVTASIGTRLSVLSLSVVDKPYGQQRLKPSEGNVAVASADPTTVRASAPVRVYTAGDSNAGLRPDSPSSPAVREMPPGALAGVERPTTAPGSALSATTSRPSTSRIQPAPPADSDALSRFAAQMKGSAEPIPAPAQPAAPAPRPMTATVPITSPRVPVDPAGSGPNTVQLTIGFEIASLQLTPALKLGAVQIRPTSNIVSVQLDATSQATLQRLLAGAAGGGTPAFEIEKLELTSGGKIALITLAPRK